MPDGPEADAGIHQFLERVDARRLHDGRQLQPADIADAAHLRIRSRHGIVDLLRGGLSPLDFDTVARNAITAEISGESALVAGLRSIVAFKRLGGRPQDKRDLEELEALYGALPEDEIPGLDS